MVLGSNDPFYFLFKNKKVTKLEDLKGLKLRGLPGFGIRGKRLSVNRLVPKRRGQGLCYDRYDKVLPPRINGLLQTETKNNGGYGRN